MTDPAGTVETMRSQRDGSDSKGNQATRIPRRLASSRISVDRSRERDMMMTSSAPSWTAAARTDRAVAPAPSMTTFPTSVTPRDRSAAPAPVTSVLRTMVLPPRRTQVFAAPSSSTVSSVSPNSLRSTLWGIVTDKPRHDSSSSSTKVRSPPGSTSTAS